MADIISIGTAVPPHCHRQEDILRFMQVAYRLDEAEARKLAFLYHKSDIQQRFSVLDEFSQPESQWKVSKPGTNGLSTGCRLKIFDAHAPALSAEAIKDCVSQHIQPKQITHLITVSCTGVSAPGLDLQIAELLQLPSNVFRTSVNFMGCYAAIHALKLAKMICDTTLHANVVVVCTEICTIHFQQAYTHENAASALLFADGSAAALVSNCTSASGSLRIKSFYSEIAYKGKDDMAWHISNHGFLMRLSTYIPHLVEEDIERLVAKAFDEAGVKKSEITHWCIHPGGKKILEVIQSQLALTQADMACSRKVLAEYGNMSSASVLFVLKEILKSAVPLSKIFGVAFGPGLTMETFIAEA